MSAKEKGDCEGGYSSRDHILKIQKMTGGMVLVAAHKKPRIADLRFFDDVKPGGNFKIKYFINCVFKDDILSRDHRYFEYSYNPGSRHDITLDLEKKKKGPDGKYVKDENVTQDEKDELLEALARLEDVGWAGATPHGVHCGIYFDKWTPIAHSRCIVGWFKDQLTRVAGYKGHLVIDPSPSVNCNRPSRHLSKLAFFRPERVLETDPVIAKNFKPVELDYSLSPSKDLPDRVKALKCRYNMMDSEETAAIVGKTVVWVEDLWDNVKQKFFNPFNQDIGQVVGPKTKEGRIIMNLKAKKRLYLNAAWSWQVCWDKGMNAMAAIAHVFNRPDFEEILGLLEQAYYESCQRNQGLPEYKNWREWVEADIERCCFKFRNGQPPQPLNRLAVKKAAVYICAHSAKNTVQVSAVAKKAGKSRVTTRKTFEMYNLKSHGTGKGKSYDVPAEWMADAALNSTQKGNLEDSSPGALCTDQKTRTKDMNTNPIIEADPSLNSNQKGNLEPSPPGALCTDQKTQNPDIATGPVIEADFASFWSDLLPRRRRPTVNLCPVEEMRLQGIKPILDPYIKQNDDWKYLTYRKKREPEHNLRDDLLDIARRCLSWDGDIVQKPGFLMEVLTAIIGPKAEAYKNWMILDGYVEDVSALVGSDKELLAWKDNLLGEARFAWRFVEHCLMGGQVEIICGEPGTGKTEELAKRLVAAGGNAVGGSAQHVNAEVLKKRIKKMGGNQEIGTVYNGYDFRIFDRRENLKEIKRKLFFVDEFGQVSCDAAGIIAMRWKKNSNVLLSVGTGQNLPVGPGRIAEDLLEWLEKHPKALPTCTITTLTKNYRADDFDSRGIVEAFQAIGRGELPQAGPGMKIVTLEDQSDVLAKVISEGTDLKALCILPTRNSAYKTAYGIVERDRYNSEIDFSDMDYKAGEIVIIDNPSENAIKHRLRNGMEVEVAEDANIHSGADAPIWIWGANNKKVLLEVSEVARKGGRTGHAVQGTERDNVVVGIITTRITTRGWLYTSVSRARQQCVIVCTKGGLDECVFSDPKRRTLLPTLLDRAYEVLKLQSTPEQIAKKAKAFVFKAKQLDGLSLARKLVNPSIPAEQHVVELLPYATRNRIRELSANGVISEKLPKVALTALNGLIVRPLSENIKLRRPFYDDREFAGIKLSERAVALRNTIGKSGPVEKVELNRLFMEAIFPDELQVVKTNVPG